LEKDEQRRRELKKRAEEAKNETVGWEDGMIQLKISVPNFHRDL
jgi:hypothetical protein